MVTQNTAFQVNEKQAGALVKFCTAAQQQATQDWQLKNLLLDVDFAYMREKNYGTEHQRAKAANSYGDKSRIQDIIVPIVMPQVESGVAYLHSVFLSGYPIFSVVAGKDNIDAALQMDTLMGEHGIRGGWVRQFNLFFRDALKYNFAALEVKWEEQTVYSVETDPLAAMQTKGSRPTEVNWSGNVIRRLDPYNTFWDTRVAPAEVHQYGEYAGYIELMSRTRFKQFVQDLPGRIIGNVKTAMESGTGAPSTFYIPELNTTAFLQREQNTSGTFDWSSWARDDIEQKIKYRNMYEVATIYARIIPQDYGMNVPARNMPQIWKLIVVNNSVLIFAERQTNAHNHLPIMVCQPLEDGLGYQTKSFSQNVIPLQDIGSALINGSLHSRRRAVYDRLAYDPSRVNAADINSSNPIARIPMRPAGYGKNPGDAFYQFPYRDDQTAGALQELQMVLSFAETTNGINRSQQGMFTKGNKTRHEYQDVMQHSNARIQTIAQFIEAQTMVPLKEILKMNILQYAPEQEIYNRENKQVVQVNPLDLRKASVEFKVADGLLPVDKIVDADTMQVALQVFGTSPQLQSEFDIVGFFIYYLKTQGMKNLEEFRYTPEQQQQRMQQAAQATTAAPAPTPAQGV